MNGRIPPSPPFYRCLSQDLFRHRWRRLLRNDLEAQSRISALLLVSGIAFTDFETPGTPESSPRNLGAIWAQNSLPGGAKSTIVGSKGNRINGTYDMMYGFDSHTLPPYLSGSMEVAKRTRRQKAALREIHPVL